MNLCLSGHAHGDQYRYVLDGAHVCVKCLALAAWCAPSAERATNAAPLAGNQIGREAAVEPDAPAVAAPISSERATKRSAGSIERIYQEAYEAAMRETQGEVNDSHKAAIMNVYEAGGREASALSATLPREERRKKAGWCREHKCPMDYCNHDRRNRAKTEGRDA